MGHCDSDDRQEIDIAVHGLKLDEEMNRLKLEIREEYECRLVFKEQKF